jgi:hypothetical protein
MRSGLGLHEVRFDTEAPKTICLNNFSKMHPGLRSEMKTSFTSIPLHVMQIANSVATLQHRATFAVICQALCGKGIVEKQDRQCKYGAFHNVLRDYKHL